MKEFKGILEKLKNSMVLTKLDSNSINDDQITLIVENYKCVYEEMIERS